jgi:hypothetical protein
MEQVYKQEFTSLLINVLSYLVQARFHSCVGLAIGVWLLVRFSIPSFHLFFTHFLITIRIHIGTSYICISFMMLVWSYHWWFIYSFVMLLMWDWTHYNPWYTSKYHCNRKWSSHTNRDFPSFPCHTWRWMGIIIIEDDFWNLTNVVTDDSTRINLI